MKILHVTDSHGSAKNPSSRIDVYYLTFLKKLAELSYVTKLNHIDMILHTGDLFHTSIVSMKFMGQVAEIIKSIDVPFYIVPGNHDINGYTIDTIDQTSLGVLVKTGVVRLLDRDHPLSLTCKGSHGDSFTVAISGQEYYADIDTGRAEDFEMDQPLADFNILGIHGYVCDKPQHPNIRHTLVQNIITDADIVLSGHWHQSFSKALGNTEFYNPGSMLRVEATPYNETFMPQYGILTIDVDEQGYIVNDYQFHKFRIAKPGSAVFDFNNIYNEKQTNITLTNFKTSLANTMASSGIFHKIDQDTIIQKVIAETFAELNAKQKTIPGITDKIIYGDIKQSINSSVANVQQNDELLIKGYIESTPKRIKKIELHNFQSHKDTVIDLEDGLNIFVGESNEGKTAIVRAINWVTNNEPNGNAFIMSGENDCYVEITYSDNSKIKRYRSIKDSGYYQCSIADPKTGNMITKTFKGFGSDIPIEILNVHQMPKISITKDLETNLNIMFQLDPAFLITSSQTQKAEAVGKIANTDVIDDVIKDTSSKALTENKLIKVYKEDLKDAENTANHFYYNIDLVNRLVAIIQRGITDIRKIVDDCKAIEKITAEYKTVVIKLDNTIKQIANIEQSLSCKPLIEEAEKLFIKLNKQISLSSQKEELSYDMLDCVNHCYKYETIIAGKDDILILDSLYKETSHQMKLYHEYLELKQKREEKDVLIISITSFIKKQKPLVEKLEALKDDTRKMVDLYNEFNKIIVKEEKINQTIEAIEHIISLGTKEVNTTQKNMKEYILSCGVCPYCGQQINEECVNEIIKKQEES